MSGVGWIPSTSGKATISINGDEIIRVVDDPNGSPVTGKVSINALKAYITSDISSGAVSSVDGRTGAVDLSGSYQPIGSYYTQSETDAALALKAPLASPALTGTPTAPTATAGTDSTQIATTAFVAAAVAGGGGGSGSAIWINVSDSPYSAAGDGTTDDLAAIQAALDAANTAGGGTVWLPAATYYVSNTLQLYDNVELRGAGNGTSTILNPAGALTGKTISGVAVYGSIAMTGVTGAAVLNLTIDHQTNGCTSNGVVIGSAGAAVRSSRCIVENVRMLGDASHQYLIWNQNADYNTVRGCYVDGGPTIPVTDTAGIEIYGGIGNLVEGCWAYHCNPGIALVQETGTAGCDLIDTRVLANRIDACGNGIVVTNANGRQLLNTLIDSNVISNCTNRGLNLGTSASGTLRNFVFTNNVTDGNATHVAIDGNGATVTDARGIVISDLTATDGSTAIYVNSTPDVVVRGGSMTGMSSSAINANVADRLDVRGVTLRSITGHVVKAYTSADVVFEGNRASEIAATLVKYEDSGSTRWSIRRNDVHRAAGNSSAVVQGTGATYITARENAVSNPPTTLYDLGSGADTDATINYVPGSTTVVDAVMPGLFVRLNGVPAGCAIYGIAGGYDGAVKVLYNNSSEPIVLYANHATETTVANRLSLGAASYRYLYAYETITLQYNGLDSRWLFSGSSRYTPRLNDIEDLSVTDGNFIVGNGSNWVAESGATARASLGLTIGTDVQAYDVDTLKADTADVLTAGYAATPYNAGTQSSGTYTPNEANGNLQYAVNGGAHTLAPPTNNCTLVIQYTNNASAGAITTSGFTKADTTALTTTDGDDFFFYVTKLGTFSHLQVVALQ